MRRLTPAATRHRNAGSDWLHNDTASKKEERDGAQAGYTLTLPRFQVVEILVQQRLTFPFPFVHHQPHDWKVDQKLMERRTQPG